MKESLSAYHSQSMSRSASLQESISVYRSGSQSKSQSVSQAAAATPDYIVSGAGTAAVNGDYYENGVYNAKPAYEKSGGGAWIWYKPPTGGGWKIGTPGGEILYKAALGSEPVPPEGTYTAAVGDPPDATVTAG